MKKVPESFELDEEDIKAAISYWLALTQTASGNQKYDVTFSVDRVSKSPPPGAPVGGMGDYSVQQISAKAVKKG